MMLAFAVAEDRKIQDLVKTVEAAVEIQIQANNA